MNYRLSATRVRIRGEHKSVNMVISYIILERNIQFAKSRTEAIELRTNSVHNIEQLLFVIENFNVMRVRIITYCKGT
jgi:hypothetical protein